MPRGRALSLYLDTSVIGGYYDARFMADTRAMWRLKEAGQFRFVSSVIVEKEIVGAPLRVRELMRDTFVGNILLPLSTEAIALASVYLGQKVVPRTYEDDARHVAICTVAGIGFLVSWNFKHLTNIRREAGFNAANLLQGYPSLRIVSPTLLIHGQEGKAL
jgi:predicted nucleic acid-binding protein